MRASWLSGLAMALMSAVLGAPTTASAQIFITPPVVRLRPWFRPRVVFLPPPVVFQPRPRVYYAPPPPPVYYAPPPPVYYAPPPPVYYAPPPPPVYYAPPPPPVYPQEQTYQPPPPPVYQPQQTYQPPPVYPQQTYQPPSVYQAPVYPAPPPQPQWGAKVGLGGRFGLLINNDQYNRFSQLGFGGELLYRASRHLSLELAGEYQKTLDGGFARYDVPVTLGLRIHIGAPNWVVSPYFVVASGVDYGSLDFLAGRDTAWFLDGQAGGGLELRLGRHLALTADVRADGRHRVTNPTDAVAATTSVDGKPFQPMQNQVGGQMRLGAALYF